MRIRSRLPGTLVVLAAILLAVAVAAFYVERNLLESDRAADRAEAALASPEVQQAAAEDVTAALVRADPDLIAVEPILRPAVEGVVGSRAFGSLVRTAVQRAHQTVFAGDGDSLVVTLSNAALLVVQALQTQAPSVAEKLPANVETTLLSLSEGPQGRVFTDLARLHHDIGVLGWVSLALALVLATAAFLLPGDRRALAVRAGIALTAAGAIALLLLATGRVVVGRLPGDSVDQDALRAIWDAYFRDLRTILIATAAVGLVIWAAARSLLRPVGLAQAMAGGMRSLATPPARTSLRILRAIAFAVVGLLVLLEPLTALGLAAIAVGLALLSLGVEELLRLVDDPAARADTQATIGAAGRRVGRRLPLAAGVGLVAVLAAAVVAAVVERPGGARAAPAACNGSGSLCERRVDEVAFPATHNSFAAARDGFLFPNQRDGIRAQLEAGMRALLIDTHMGVDTPRGVYTLLDEDGKSREKLELGIGPRGVATAERLRADIGYRGGGDPEPYLCHGFCELGATKAVDSLREIASFLAANPGEVLVLSIEDQITPRQTEQAFEESGLLDFVWQGPIDPLPTLREMVDDGGRVLVFGEEETEGVDWYHPQFETVQETPFDITSVDDLLSPDSCRRNRGEAGNPVLMLNHWVENVPPRASQARRVNQPEEIADRARRCREALGAFPAILAIDFWQEGDVVAAAAELNGLGP